MQNSIPTLIVNNSMSQITGLTGGQEKALRKILSYAPDPKTQFFSGGYRNARRYLIDKKGHFPSGLLYLVQGYLKNNGLQVNFTDRRTPFKRQGRLFSLSLHLPPYPDQKNAAKAILERNGRGIVVAPTGSGKSVIIALIIDAIQVPTLVVVPSLELKKQLSEFLGKVFGAKAMNHITVENVDALDPDKLDTKHQLVICDEFHHSAALTYRKLNKRAWAGIYGRVGLTATPFRSQDHERLLLESFLSEVVYRIPYTKSVDLGQIVPLNAYYVTVPRTRSKAIGWAAVYNELVVNNEARNQIIADMVQKLADAGKSTLVLVKEIAHGAAIQKLCQDVPFVKGENEDNREVLSKFSSGKINALIGTTGVCGEGVDTKACEFVIIAGLGKSKNAFMQQCGRGFRKYPGKESCSVIIFKDDSHKYTKSHYKEQVKILLDEYGAIPVEL